MNIGKQLQFNKCNFFPTYKLIQIIESYFKLQNATFPVENLRKNLSAQKIRHFNEC